MIKKEKGITIIALVITIIVLLILAGVTIVALSGDNGILKRASEARDQTILADEDEQQKLDDMNSYIDQMIDEKQKQQETLNSLRTLNEEKQFYSIEYTADYKFDEYLESGSTNIAETMEFCSDNLLGGQQVDAILSDIGCTTFSAKTPEGNAIFARNMDLERNTPALIVKTNPTNGYKSISTSDLGMIVDLKNGIPSNISDKHKRELLVAPYITVDGMNEAGVAVATLLLEDTETTQKTGKVPITATTILRLILDKAGSVDEAINLVRNYDMHSEYKNFHLQVTDKTGASVVIEYVNNELQIIELEGKSFQVCSNFYLSPSMEDNNHASGTAEVRYNTAYQELDKVNGILSEENAMMGLQQLSQGPATKWSMIYNQTNLTLQIAPNIDYREESRIKLDLIL